MSESNEEKLQRVRMMAQGTYDIWDHSDNDVLALQYVLERLEQCEALLNAYRKIHDGNALDDSSGVVEQCGCKLCNAARVALEGNHETT